MFNSLKSATPEQKLWTLAHELITPVEIIRGFASVIKKDIESNKIESAQMLKDINRIADAADRIKNLLDELHQSK